MSVAKAAARDHFPRIAPDGPPLGPPVRPSSDDGAALPQVGVVLEARLGPNLGRLDLLRADTRIATTHHGSYGSSRSESALWPCQALDGAGRARVQRVPGLTPFTLDSAALLPGTNRQGRVEDSLAAVLAHYCLPDSRALGLPLAMGHVRESLRPRFSRGGAGPRATQQ